MGRFAVYIVKTADNFLYVGMTNNIQRRFKEHCAGIKSFIRNKVRPFKLVYIEYFNIKTDAAKREKQIKGYRREKKNILIQEYNKYKDSLP